MNWRCQKCGEILGFHAFEACWNCGQDRAHSTPIDAGNPNNQPPFGELYWDAELNCWIATYPKCSPTPFVLRVEGAANSNRAISTLQREAFATISPGIPQIAEEAARLYSASNADAPEDLNEFLRPEVILVMDDGVIEVWFEDGTDDGGGMGYFAGHTLVYRRHPNGEVEVFSDWR